MKPIRLIVAGCRNFKNAELIFKTLLTIFEKVDYNNIEIVSGGCVGVDTIAIEFAKSYNITFDAPTTLKGRGFLAPIDKSLESFVKDFEINLEDIV